MISSSKLKSVDFYRKIPRDLTEASLSGAGLSIVAALAIIFLFGMELSSYLALTTSTSVVVDKSPDGEFLRIDFNMSFPALSCEFASVDVSDVLGTNRLNITKTIRKFSIDSHLRPIGPEFLSGATTNFIKHDDDGEEDYGEGSLVLNGQNFERAAKEHDILVVNFYAPWCYWSKRLKPSWEKVAIIMRERHDPEADGRILLGKVDCTVQVDLCRRHHVQGYPSIRVFRKGSDVKNEHGHHEHESYYGDRDTDTLLKFMESLVSAIPLGNQTLALEDKSSNKTQNIKRLAPPSGGCRIEGFVRVKKVPGNLVVSAHSGSHSFDASKMNMSHVITHLSFGTRISPRVMTDAQRIIPYLGASHDRLSGKSYINQDEASNAYVTIEHYLQVVKTEVRAPNEHTLLEEYEYTAHSSLIQSPDIPVAKFHFELSPMQVLITENSRSFSHFLTNICAIIGGVFTVIVLCVDFKLDESYTPSKISVRASDGFHNMKIAYFDRLQRGESKPPREIPLTSVWNKDVIHSRMKVERKRGIGRGSVLERIPIPEKTVLGRGVVLEKLIPEKTVLGRGEVLEKLIPEKTVLESENTPTASSETQDYFAKFSTMAATLTKNMSDMYAFINKFEDVQIQQEMKIVIKNLCVKYTSTAHLFDESVFMAEVHEALSKALNNQNDENEATPSLQQLQLTKEAHSFETPDVTHRLKSPDSLNQENTQSQIVEDASQPHENTQSEENPQEENENQENTQSQTVGDASQPHENTQKKTPSPRLLKMLHNLMKTPRRKPPGRKPKQKKTKRKRECDTSKESKKDRTKSSTTPTFTIHDNSSV